MLFVATNRTETRDTQILDRPAIGIEIKGKLFFRQKDERKAITPDEHSMPIPVREPGCQFAISNLVPTKQLNQLDMMNPGAVLMDSDTTIPPTILMRPPAEKPGHGMPELRTHFERRFAGKRFTPHSTRWVAQQIYERDVPAEIGILSTWTHHRRRVEVTEAAIAQLNTLSDYDSILAIQEMLTETLYSRRQRQSTHYGYPLIHDK